MFTLIRRYPFGLLPVWLAVVTINDATAAVAAWQTDFRASQATAKAQNKVLLVAFTGSDWCPWCKKINAEIFEKEAFLTAAHKRFILVNIDFPHKKKLSDELKQQNEKLARAYKINSFPSVTLIKPDGELMARTGYSSDGPEKYLKQLNGLMKTYDSVVVMRGHLAATNGLDRAKLLDRLIQGYVALGNENDILSAWRREVVALDPENSAGLKRKYEFRVRLDDARVALNSGRPAAAEAIIDKALALPHLGPQQIQRAALVKSPCCLARKDYQASLDCLRKALEAAPKGDNADAIKALMQRSKKLMDGQKAKENVAEESK